MGAYCKPQLKTPSNRIEEDPVLTASVLVEQLEEWIEQRKDPKLRDILAAFVRDIRGYM